MMTFNSAALDAFRPEWQAGFFYGVNVRILFFPDSQPILKGREAEKGG